MMKRFLTLLMISLLIFTLGLAGCTNVPGPQPPMQSQNNGDPPKAEAETREDVLGPEKRIVMGFYTDEEGEIHSSKDSVLKHGNILDEVAFFWYTFDGKGNVFTAGKKDLSIKESVQKKGAKAYALVHNMRKGLFDANLAHQVLANPEVRVNFVKNLVNLTVKEKWDGISVDIEKTPPADRNNFTKFVGELL